MRRGPGHLVQMANDIGNFFASEPDRALAIEGMAGHIGRYWEKRMRMQIFDYLDHGGEGLSDLAREAIAKLAAQQPGAAPT